MGLLSEVKEEFGANGLYELLEVAKGCSESQLNKAYKKAARKYHPDKAQEAEKETATRRFQILSRAHAVLASKDARKVRMQAKGGNSQKSPQQTNSENKERNMTVTRSVLSLTFS